MEIKIPYYEDNTRLNNSALGWFLISPSYFKRKIDGTVDSESTKAMDNGTMIHEYLLQPHEFWKDYQILDFVKPSTPQQKQFCDLYIASTANKAKIKAIEAFKGAYSTSGKSEEKIATESLEMALKLKSYIKYLRLQNSKTLVSWAGYNALKLIKENVILHKKANELLFNNTPSSDCIINNEFHINWVFPKEYYNIKIDCKSLLDRLIIDHENKKITLVDIKTTSSIKDFSDSVIKYDYYRQMSFYWYAIVWYFKEELKLDIEEYKQETYIVAIQTNDNYEVKVFKLQDEKIVEKIQIIADIISDICWHHSTNNWDYSRDYYEGDGSEILK